jgi:predicted PurR-regulated permease PerM
VSFLREVARTLSLYVRGQIRIMSILAVLYLTGFALLGVPLWPVWGLLGGLLHPVPFCGVIFGLVLPLLASWLDGGGELWRILGVTGVFVAVQTLEGFVLTPRILGTRLGIGPMTVFLAALIGGAFFGPLGVLFAAPAAAIAALAWKFVKRS